MENYISNIRIEGVTVIIDYFPGEIPGVNYGHFQVKNEINRSIKMEISRLFFIAGDDREELEAFKVYNLPNHTLAKDGFLTVEKNSSKTFWITIERKDFFPIKYAEYALEAEIKLENFKQVARSNYEFIEEMPFEWLL